MSSLNVSCDVLVIGAGLDGGSAAFETAVKGLGVIILEKKREVGRPVRCAEYIPLQVLHEISFPTAVLVQRIEEMVTHLPDGKKVVVKSPGLIINRDELDRYLIYKATERGANLYLETRAISYDGRYVLAKRGDDLISISSRVIIGADGPLSTVGKWMGVVNKEFIKTAQYVMSLKEKKNATEVYFSKNIPGGYGWVFPKLEVANVGVGVNSKLGITAKQALEYFTKRLLKKNIY